jgi:hypothetical protein
MKCTRTHEYTRTQTHTYVHIHTYIHTDMCVCVYTGQGPTEPTYLPTHPPTHTHTNTYLHACIRTNIFTHMYTQTVGRGTFAENKFWIDEFSLSRTPRIVKQSAPPALPNDARARVVSLTKKLIPGGVNFTVTLTSEDCKAPLGLDFEIQVVNTTTGTASSTSTPPSSSAAGQTQGQIGQATVRRVQDHSEHMSGDVVVSLRGQMAKFDVLSTADEVKRALLDGFKDVKDLSVVRTASCQLGYGWFVTFTGDPGDLPSMEVDGTFLKGPGGVNVTVKTIEDGMTF